MSQRQRVTAVVLAAGQSRRMGRPKLLLPWGDTTVLDHCLAQLEESNIEQLLVVSGYRADAVEAIARARDIPIVYNPEYATGEMLSSLQQAIRTLPPAVEAVLVVLADQPLLTANTINQILDSYRQGGATLVAPSYRGRRGNPVLIDRDHFPELLALPAGAAPRVLLSRHRDRLELVEVDSEAILLDLDRPEDYERHRPTSDLDT